LIPPFLFAKKTKRKKGGYHDKDFVDEKTVGKSLFISSSGANPIKIVCLKKLH
jgi:hypothetical protein